jgi:hypothetical protein
LLNAVAFSLLFAAWLQGWLDGVRADTTFELTLVIFAVFFYGLVLCAGKVWRASVDLNDLSTGAPPSTSSIARYLSRLDPNNSAAGYDALGALRLDLSHRVAIVRHFANALVFLGLIGTVIGFILALSGVNPATSTDADNVAKMVATLIGGMSVALYTTLVGAILHVWLIVNHRMLVSGTVALLQAIVAHQTARATDEPSNATKSGDTPNSDATPSSGASNG